MPREPDAGTARDLLFEGNYLLNANHASYDISPDGKSFLMFRPVTGTREETIIVHNWTTELRAQDKRAGQP